MSFVGQSELSKIELCKTEHYKIELGGGGGGGRGGGGGGGGGEGGGGG